MTLRESSSDTGLQSVATDQNIVYLDLYLGVVKLSHHTKFDEAWYLQPSRPPAEQLLYDLGFLQEDDTISDVASTDSGTDTVVGYTAPGTDLQKRYYGLR